MNQALAAIRTSGGCKTNGVKNECPVFSEFKSAPDIVTNQLARRKLRPIKPIIDGQDLSFKNFFLSQPEKGRVDQKPPSRNFFLVQVAGALFAWHRSSQPGTPGLKTPDDLPRGQQEGGPSSEPPPPQAVPLSVPGSSSFIVPVLPRACPGPERSQAGPT